MSNKSSSIPAYGSYYDKYLPLDGKTFTQEGEKYRIHARKSLAIYPYKHYQTNVDIENLTTASEYCFSSLDCEATFCEFVEKLESLLLRYNLSLEC